MTSFTSSNRRDQGGPLRESCLDRLEIERAAKIDDNDFFARIEFSFQLLGMDAIHP